MTLSLSGIHHVTAIASGPQENIDFYVGVLGLRLLKITVNFDDPKTYHLYYGDETGSPGTILSFFAWPEGNPGQQGPGQATAIAFAVPPGTLEWWRDRLKRHRVPCEGTSMRFGMPAMGFYDHDGLTLELVEDPSALARPVWQRGTIPPEQATRGIHSVTLGVREADATVEMLATTLGLKPVAAEGGRQRFNTCGEGPGQMVDVLALPGAPRATGGVGTVHHVGLRTPTSAEQREWRELLAAQKRQVSPATDRHYFQSITFREPGGILCEISTDQPGFLIDEPKEMLGGSLHLPAWLEGSRPEIEKELPPIVIPLAFGPQS